MKRPFSRLGAGLALWLGAAAATGCAPSNKVKPGQPVLLSFSAVTPTNGPAPLKDKNGDPIRGPAIARYVAVFDRILDPTALEEPPDGGEAVPMAGVASIDTPDMTIPLTTLYVPNGDVKFTLALDPGPSITVSLDTVKWEKGLPSGTPVTVTLSPEHVRSHDKTQPFVAADGTDSPLSYTTEDFGVGFDAPTPTDDGDGGVVPAEPVDPTFVCNVTFNNLTVEATKDLITVSATVAGAPVAALGAVVALAEGSQNAFTVSPPMAGWPAGAVVTITVAGTAANLYMQTMGTAATATFTVKS